VSARGMSLSAPQRGQRAHAVDDWLRLGLLDAFVKFAAGKRKHAATCPIYSRRSPSALAPGNLQSVAVASPAHQLAPKGIMPLISAMSSVVGTRVSLAPKGIATANLNPPGAYAERSFGIR
jgi:hypothetical protein